ncbi:MAG: hypothetical protein QOH00_538 [Gaiellales bacterium]|nr:hypothetical protein [Gaiellales bacterium]
MGSRTRLATMLAVVGIALAAPAVAEASGEYEPNDTPYTAAGPIADGTYSATIETANDQDWYRVDTSQRDVQIQIDTTNDSGCGSCSLLLSITDSQGSNLDDTGTYANAEHGGETAHAAYTLREPGTYYLSVTSNARPSGVPYHFTMSRTAGSPVPPTGQGGGSSQACVAARGKVRRAYTAVRGARARYRHHHTPATRRSRNSAKRHLQHALSVRAGAC